MHEGIIPVQTIFLMPRPLSAASLLLLNGACFSFYIPTMQSAGSRGEGHTRSPGFNRDGPVNCQGQALGRPLGLGQGLPHRLPLGFTHRAPGSLPGSQHPVGASALPLPVQDTLQSKACLLLPALILRIFQMPLLQTLVTALWHSVTTRELYHHHIPPASV